MTDIVLRLRDSDCGWSGDAVCISAEVAEEGAREIEALRTLLREVTDVANAWCVSAHGGEIIDRAYARLDTDNKSRDKN